MSLVIDHPQPKKPMSVMLFYSFVAQQIDFQLEIIVADDASTQTTPAIIQEYVDRYLQGLLACILRPKNLGSSQEPSRRLVKGPRHVHYRSV